MRVAAVIRSRRRAAVLARVLGGMLGAVCAAALLAAPATGQALDEDPDAVGLGLHVQELTGTLAPGSDLTVSARVSNEATRDAEALRVVGTLHSAVSSRFAFQRAVDDGQLAAVVDGFSTDIDELGGGRSTVVELTRSAAELGFRRADQHGVYPLRLQLLRDGTVVDEVRTAVVFAPDRVDEPVRAALVVPINAEPLLRPDGSYDRGRILAELGHGGRAQGLIGSLAARDRFPATVAADTLLLDEAADVSRGVPVADGDDRELAPDDFLADQARLFLDRATQVASRHDVDLLGVPYARADLTALVRGDMQAEALRHVRDGVAGPSRVLDTAALRGALWPADALNAATLAVVADAGADTLLVGESHLDLPDGRGLSPSPVRRASSARGHSPTVLVPDPWLEEALEREAAPDGVAVAAQRILAETATVYFERPFAAAVRGLLLVPPQGWDPARGLAGRLMDGLADASWVEPVTLSELARVVDPESDRVRLSYPSGARARELPPTYVAELREARRALGSLAHVLVPGDETPSRFDQRLRTASSVAYRPPDSGPGREMIAAVADTVESLYSSVDLVPGPQVWMDAEGPVPVTVANGADVPLRIRVRLLTQRFTFEQPEGQVVLLDANETHTLTFQAQAVTPGGRAPISVVVRDPAESITLAAVIVTAAAGLFLLGWFVQQWSRRRKEGQPDDEPELAPRATPTKSLK